MKNLHCKHEDIDIGYLKYCKKCHQIDNENRKFLEDNPNITYGYKRETTRP